MVSVLWAASPIAGSTTSTGASCAVSTVILVLVMHGNSLVADATTLTASAFIADVATRIRVMALIAVSRLRKLLIWRQITLMWITVSVRIILLLSAGLTSAVLLLRVLMVTPSFDRHLRYLRFLHLARLFILSILSNL